ncbi:MAG: hypothetical protein R3Y11_02275 [Pseudomonadota bacterium]
MSQFVSDSFLSLTKPPFPPSTPPNTPLSKQKSQPSEDLYILHYIDSDHCEQCFTCKTIYDALVWAREEAQEHASSVRIYKLCHIELAP